MTMTEKSNKFELLKQISSLDFMAIDLNLYLDTHPTDLEALAKFHAATMQAKELRQHYERLYGPLTALGSQNPNAWQWICDPWPWQYEANFKMDGEEK